MKRKKLGAGLLCAALAVPAAVPVTSFAAQAPEVVYDGEEKEFTLKNVSERDLFPEFKNVVPGDNIEQTIKVRVENTDAPVTVYLSAEGGEDTGRELFQDVMLKVEAGGKTVSEAPLSGDGRLGEGVELFTFNAPGEQSLDVTLSVAPEAGNELMDAMTSVRWTFTVQDYDNGGAQQGMGSGSVQSSAQTGDATDTRPWTAGVVCCAGIAAGTVILKKKRSDRTKKDA